MSSLKVCLILLMNEKPVFKSCNSITWIILDLPAISPLSHGVQRAMQQWCVWLQKQLESAGPTPANYIPGCTVENINSGPPILRYRSILDPNNTPFS